MGSFAGVNVDAQNLQNVVLLAEQKKLEMSENSIADYRDDFVDKNFPDGEYYVITDFISTEIQFQGGLPPRLGVVKPLPVKKVFKKGDLVEVKTVITSTALTKTKAIVTPIGNFSFNLNNLSKTKPIQNIVPEVVLETKDKDKNQNKLIIMVIGAFVLGYLLTKE